MFSGCGPRSQDCDLEWYRSFKKAGSKFQSKYVQLVPTRNKAEGGGVLLGCQWPTQLSSWVSCHCLWSLKHGYYAFQLHGKSGPQHWCGTATRGWRGASVTHQATSVHSCHNTLDIGQKKVWVYLAVSFKKVIEYAFFSRKNMHFPTDHSLFCIWTLVNILSYLFIFLPGFAASLFVSCLLNLALDVLLESSCPGTFQMIFHQRFLQLLSVTEIHTAILYNWKHSVCKRVDTSFQGRIKDIN